MTPETLSLINGLLTSYFVEYSAPIVLDSLEKIFTRKPEVVQQFQDASSMEELEEATKELRAVIEVLAKDGEIEIDKVIFEALDGILFNHQDGKILINGSEFKSQDLKLGGKGIGSTTITNSISETPHTKINVQGNGSNITIKGNAQINQKG